MNHLQTTEGYFSKAYYTVPYIVNPNWRNAVCVYVGIGQRLDAIAKLYEDLKKTHSAWNNIFIIASASEPAAFQFISAYTGCVFGEYFRDNGTDAVVIYDDLTKHSISYRQLSNIIGIKPGREAYPGDIFYIHSRLLERAGSLHSLLGNGSLTAFPVIETQFGDLTGYIPTNIISITDGQLFIDTEVFYKGVRPAINYSLSVSRIGSKAQVDCIINVGHSWKSFLASYKETETFAYFGISNAYINRILFRGAKLEKLLHQDFDEFLLTSEEQCIVLYAGMYGYLDEIDNEDINQYERVILNFFQNIESRSHILDIVDTLFLFSLTKETEKRLIEGLDFLANYFNQDE